MEKVWRRRLTILFGVQPGNHPVGNLPGLKVGGADGYVEKELYIGLTIDLGGGIKHFALKIGTIEAQQKSQPARGCIPLLVIGRFLVGLALASEKV
jgi:hypothetical protein